MSAKNRDNKNRWRNITVGFRVSPEENELINKAVALSGLPKQEYCYRRCLNQDVVVQGNPRIFKALKTELATVLTELKRIEAGNGVDEELLNVIELIAVIMGGLKGEDEDGNKRKRLPWMYLLAQIRSSQFVKTLQVVYPRMVEISRVLRNCREKCRNTQRPPQKQAVVIPFSLSLFAVS